MFNALSWAAEAPCETPAQKAILLMLAQYAGSDGSCYPGQVTLARQACCSEKTVERALAWFESRGWIERRVRRRANGSRTSDLILLLVVAAPERFEAACVEDEPDDAGPETGGTDAEHAAGTDTEHSRNLQPDTMSGRGGPTRHPVHSHPTSCPKSPDTMSGPIEESPEEHPEETRGGRSRDPVKLTNADCERFWSAYPEEGRANFARASLPIALGRHAVRLGGVEALIGAARAYAAAIRKADTKPKALGNWLADPALVDQYAAIGRASAPPDAAGLTERQWRSYVGYFSRHDQWDGPGPKPGAPGCRAPAAVLADYGFGGIAPGDQRKSGAKA